jgi:hypothetical protein
MRLRPAAITAALVISVVAGPVANSDGGSTTAGEPKVACWNHYFPFEPEPPDFIEAPRKCLWYMRNAETYTEGALLGKKLKWSWHDDGAQARGTLKVPGVGDGFFARGWVELSKPTKSCGRLVFARIKYRLREPSGRSGSYPIYTCRSNPN